jgi:folylpolyglutamate synthase/dihydropteroate synthase
MSDKLGRAIQILKNLNQPDRVVKRNNINFVKIMDVLGNPYNTFKSIHITGTNGKGSVAMKTAKIL